MAVSITVVIGLLWTPRSLVLIGLVALLKIADGYSDLYSLELQKQNRYRPILSFMLFRTGAGVACAVLIAFSSGNLEGSILGLVGISGAVTLGIMRGSALKRDLSADVSPNPTTRWKPVMKAGIYVGLADGITSFGASAPQYALAHFDGGEALVAYSYGYYIFIALEMVLNARILVWLKGGDHSLKGSANHYVRSAAICLPLASVGIGAVLLLSKFLAFPFAFSDSVALAALGGAVLVLPAVYVLNGRMMVLNQYARTMRVGAVTALVYFVSSFTLVRSFGVGGAFLGSLAGASARLALLVGAHFASRRSR